MKLIHVIKSVIPALLLSVAISSFAGDVQVEEIPTGTEKSASLSDKAAETWQKTKDASGKALEYSVEKSTDALDASKVGIAKGAEFVGDTTSKAWDYTKNAASKAGEFTSEKIQQVGDSLKTPNTAEPEVQDKSL